MSERFVLLKSQERSRSTEVRSWARLMTRSSRPSTLRTGSWSVSRSSRAGCRVSRALTSTISRLRPSQLDAPNAQEGILIPVGGQHALAPPAEDLRCHLVPLSLPSEPDQPVRVRLRAGVAGGEQGRRLASVGKAEMGRHPHD